MISTNSIFVVGLMSSPCRCHACGWIDAYTSPLLWFHMPLTYMCFMICLHGYLYIGRHMLRPLGWFVPMCFHVYWVGTYMRMPLPTLALLVYMHMTRSCSINLQPGHIHMYCPAPLFFVYVLMSLQRDLCSMYLLLFISMLLISLPFIHLMLFDIHALLFFISILFIHISYVLSVCSYMLHQPFLFMTN